MVCKSLIGEVVTLGSGEVTNPIRNVTLFDTSTEKDLNLNEQLIQKLDPSGGSSRASPVSSSSSKSPVPSTLAPKAAASAAPNAAGAGASKEEVSKEASDDEEEDEALLDLACLKELVPPSVPAVGDYFDINVTFAASPSNFTVQPWSSSQSLEDLQESIQKFYSSPKHQKEMSKQQLDGDKFFAALHSDKCWYRVRVNSYLDEFTVAVRFVDYGDHAMISISNLQVLRSQFRNLPMQAVSGCLAGNLRVNISKA